jgi:hypothetical protein
LGYAISFGIGQFIVLIFIWLLRYLYNVHQCQGDFNEGFQALPSLHVREMWLPGALCGALWEISNIGSLVSVQFLGEGVGFSVVQAALLVSGTFWFITKDISLSAFLRESLQYFFLITTIS